MEFTFETEYNDKALTAMAKALRKTVRKKKNRRSHIFGAIVAVLGLVVIARDFAFDFSTIITMAAVLVLLLTLFFEDRLNGHWAKKRLLPGTKNVVSHFSAEGFTTITEAGKTDWKYDKIQTVIETGDAFVFAFSKNHGQIYDKNHLQGGTVDEFRRFNEAAT